MLLRKKVAEMQKEVDGAHQRINNWAYKHQGLKQEFEKVRDEIATNGVVRDIRNLEKSLVSFMEEVDSRFRELSTNGMATQVNKLSQEVFGSKKDSNVSAFVRSLYSMSGLTIDEEVTLAGKVDAIIEHLGIDVTIKPQEIIDAKVEVKKKPITKKKNGKR